MKDELVEKIMKNFFGLRAKTYSYFIDGCSKDKKSKRHKKCFIKRQFKDYKNCLEATQLENEINHLKKMKLT